MSNASTYPSSSPSMFPSSYTSSSYVAPLTVEVFNSVPRFGHSDDLVSVITREEGWQDYAKGTIMIGCLILATFTVWTILEVLFLSCGRRVGILSGRRIFEDNKGGNCFYRFLVLSNCVLSFMVGVVFLVKVTASFEETFDNVRESTSNLADIARNVTTVVDMVIKAGKDTVPVRDTGVEMLENGICSSFPGGNGQTIDFDANGFIVMDKLTLLSDFTNGPLTTLRGNFQNEFISAETEINLVLEQAQNYAKISYYAIAIVVATFLLSLQGHMAWFGPRWSAFFIIQKWITLPVYFLLLLFSSIVTAALSSVLIVNTDICLGGNGSPESFIRSILDTQNLNSYTKEILDFYILDGCRGSFEGLDLIGQLVEDLKDGNQAVIDLDSILEADQSYFEALCGGEDGSLDAFKSSLSTMSPVLSSFVFAAEDARNLLQCEPINALYKDFMHGDVCESLPNTTAWMFSTTLLVVVFGISVFTLRGALLPPIPRDIEKELESSELEDYEYNEDN